MIFILLAERVFTARFLPYCSRAEITWIDFAYSADAHFPNLEESGEWEMTEESDEQTYFDLCYTYRVYEKQRTGK